jgi:polar amino acid transport system substrate-binding protein
MTSEAYMDRRTFINLLKTASIAGPVAAATTHFIQPKQAKENAERVMDTRKMRCSYITYAPFIIKDANTGEMSGLFYDLTQKIGEIADLEMDWNVETTYAEIGNDLEQKKFDLFAGGIWPDARRAKVADFSEAAFYSGLGVFVRNNDHRFDGNVSKLNDARYRIATIDGEMSQIVQQSDFPNASVLSMPDTTDISLLVENVATNKADTTICEKAVANLYMLKNPNSLRNLCDANPIRIFENTWAFAYGAPQLKTVIDTAVKEMLYSGYVDKVLAKYEQIPGSFYRVRPPIQ